MVCNGKIKHTSIKGLLISLLVVALLELLLAKDF